MPRRRRSIAGVAIPGVARRRRRKTVLTAIIGLIAAIIIAADHAGYFKTPPDAPPPTEFNDKTFTVSRVIDGDTVIIVPPGGGGPTNVRLLGIDAPEMHFHTDEQPDFWAEHSTQWLTQQVEGKTVLIRTNPPKERDQYDRLLAYVIVDGTRNISLESLSAGESYADRRFSHPLKKDFEQAEAQAQRSGQGLWKNVKESQMPPWRQRRLDEQK